MENEYIIIKSSLISTKCICCKKLLRKMAEGAARLVRLLYLIVTYYSSKLFFNNSICAYPAFLMLSDRLRACKRPVIQSKRFAQRISTSFLKLLMRNVCVIMFALKKFLLVSTIQLQNSSLFDKNLKIVSNCN